jgi:N-acetylglucosamine kinase-like BadF-type ATPase
LLGDEGSGFAIGRAAVQHALQKMEAEERLSTLAESVCNHLKANSVTGITRTIYGSSNPRRLVASLAILVVKLAEEEDGEAREILEKAGADLANLVVRTVAIVGNQREVIKIAAAGGVLINSNYVQQRLIAELQNHGLNFEINFVRDPLAGCMRLVEAGFAENLVTWHKSEAT